MSTFSIRIPESLHKRVKVLASQDNISISQFIATALAEKLSALDTEKYLNVLENVKDREPQEFDGKNRAALCWWIASNFCWR